MKKDFVIALLQCEDWEDWEINIMLLTAVKPAQGAEQMWSLKTGGFLTGVNYSENVPLRVWKGSLLMQVV